MFYRTNFQLSLNKRDVLAGEDETLDTFGIVTSDIIHIIGPNVPQVIFLKNVLNATSWHYLFFTASLQLIFEGLVMFTPSPFCTKGRPESGDRLPWKFPQFMGKTVSVLRE